MGHFSSFTLDSWPWSFKRQRLWEENAICRVPEAIQSWRHWKKAAGAKGRVKPSPLSSRKQKTCRSHPETFASQISGETQESTSPVLGVHRPHSLEDHVGTRCGRANEEVCVKNVKERTQGGGEDYMWNPKEGDVRESGRFQSLPWLEAWSFPIRPL